MNLKIKETLIVLLCTLFFCNIIVAQKNVKTTFEDIKKLCKDEPKENRIRVTVPRFSVTTNAAPSEFGGNLATMLTNALQNVNCFRVLESLVNKSDMNDEIDYGESQYADKKTGAKKGKQLGAQVVVTGEVTEYNSKNSSVGVSLLKIGSNKAKIGFILKVVNPQTREVLFSKSINTEAKVGGGTEFGAFGVNLISAGTSDPAVSNACEQGIIKAVEYLISVKDQLDLPGQTKTTTSKSYTKSVETNTTEITVNKATFATFTEFATLLSTVPGYKTVEKSFKDKKAIYSVTYEGDNNTFFDELTRKIASKYEVKGFENGKIELVNLVKQ